MIKILMSRLSFINAVLFLTATATYGIQLQNAPQLAPAQKCAIEIICRHVDTKSVSLVNAAENEEFTKQIYTNQQLKVKNFLVQSPMRAKLSNTVYVILAKDYGELQEVVTKLRHDHFWNPRAFFIITVDKISHQLEINEAFKTFFYHYMHKLLLIVGNGSQFAEMYRYSAKYRKKACRFKQENVISESCLQNETTVGSFLKTAAEHRAQCPLTLMFLNYLRSKEMALTGEYSMIKTLLKAAKIRFTVVNNDKQLPLGLVFDNFTSNGALELIDKGKIDGVLGVALLTFNRLQKYEIIRPIAHTAVVVAHRPALIRKWELMLMTFSNKEASVLCFFVLISFTIVARIFDLVRVKGFGRWPSTYLIVYGYFLHQNQGLDRRRDARMFFATLLIFSWLFNNLYYYCRISRVLTQPIRNPRKSSMKEMFDANYTVYLSRNMLTEAEVNSGLNVMTMPSVSRSYVECQSPMECLDCVVSDHNGFTVTSALMFSLHPHRDTYGEDILYRLPTEYGLIMVAQYFKSGHPVLPILRKKLKQYYSAGIHVKIAREVKYTVAILGEYKKRWGHQIYRRQLSCSDLAGMFYVCASGCTASFVVLLVELYWNRRSIRLKDRNSNSNN